MENFRENGFFLIPNYENYAIDTKRCRVINLKTNKEVLSISSSKVKKFKLFKNGQAYFVTLFDIYHWVIQKYFNSKSIPK